MEGVAFLKRRAISFIFKDIFRSTISITRIITTVTILVMVVVLFVATSIAMVDTTAFGIILVNNVIDALIEAIVKIMGGTIVRF